MNTRLIRNINRSVAQSLRYEGRVLDLGCGSSPYKSIILQTATEYVGVDWESTLHRDNTPDVVADISKPLPFPEDHADTVVAFQVLEHLPEPAAFLTECLRILRPGGLLHLTVPFMWKVHEAPHDYYRFTRYGLAHVLGQAGFVEVDIRATTGFWQTWVLKFNYQLARSRHPALRLPSSVIYRLGDWLAPKLDQLGMDESETASYVASARAGILQRS